jgi:hypothetical protein
VLKYKQSGNALFLILIAVALFATLSYAVTQSGRGGGNTSQEENRLQASQIMQYGAGIKASLDRMRLISNLSENEISFENTVFKKGDGTDRQPASYYPNCSDTSCQLFHQNGAGATPIIFSEKAILVDSPVPGGGTAAGHSRFVAHGIQGVGTSAPELVLTVNYLRPEVCMAINDILDIPNDSGNVPIDPVRLSGSYASYQNDLSSAAATFVAGDDYAPFAGQTSFCLQWNDSGAGISDFDYIYYHVLIER